HHVVGASSGLHALDILRSEQPIDLMMTDHVMPGMTGIELAAASRRVRPSLPILLATGYAELPDGAQPDLPRLAKPYHQDQLRDRLDQLLGGSLLPRPACGERVGVRGSLDRHRLADGPPHPALRADLSP